MLEKQTLKATIVLAPSLGLSVIANAQLLGTADTFSVLAGSTVTSTGPTILWGNMGVSPGSSITGFPPGTLNGTKYLGDAVATLALADANAAYTTLAGEAPNQNLTGQDLGGLTLLAGVYHFDSSAFLTGNLILDAQGDPNALFDFQIGSTLISASNSSVQVINAGDGRNVYWQVGSSATLGTDSAFAGRIIALASVTMNTNASLNHGSADALTGAITLDSNLVVVPEPGTTLTCSVGLLALASLRRRRYCSCLSRQISLGILKP